MGRILDILGSRSLEGLVGRARRRLATGDLDQAGRLVARGLGRWPEAEALRELELTIRRAQARAGMHSLKDRVAQDGDPRAYEELIELYLELGMHAEARREALAYAEAHARRDTPWLLLGEMALQDFFADLRASDAHAAREYLLRAARLAPEAVKPRLLLAELFFCVGADRALGIVTSSLDRLAGDDPTLEGFLEEVHAAADDEGPERLDGLFERVEVQGALVREPTSWPLKGRRARVERMDAERAEKATRRIVDRGEACEVVVMQRGGTVLGHAALEGDAACEGGEGLVEITRAVASTVAPYVRELDLGAFRRCLIQGGFGVMAIGEVGGVVAGARWRASPEPQRLWDRVAMRLDASRGGVQ